jgi:hypothetical protein
MMLHCACVSIQADVRAAAQECKCSNNRAGAVFLSTVRIDRRFTDARSLKRRLCTQECNLREFRTLTKAVVYSSNAFTVLQLVFVTALANVVHQ